MARSEEVEFEDVEKCPNCGAFVGENVACDNCGAVLSKDDELDAFEGDEEEV